MVNKSAEIFCFTIGTNQFAIPLSTVDRVISAVAVSPVPNAPPVIHGIFDYHGMLVPVINLRQRLKMTDYPVRINDIFILADTAKRKIALVADYANGLVNVVTKDLICASDLDPGFEAKGILRRDDGIILIYDIEQFLAEQDEIDLQEALDKQDKQAI